MTPEADLRQHYERAMGRIQGHLVALAGDLTIWGLCAAVDNADETAAVRRSRERLEALLLITSLRLPPESAQAALAPPVGKNTDAVNCKK